MNQEVSDMIYSSVASSLTKIINDMPPVIDKACLNLTALKGDSLSFQVIYFSDTDIKGKISVRSDLGKAVTVRSVEYVPVSVISADPVHLSDFGYISNKPFRCPDVLRKMRGNKLSLKAGKYRTVLVDIELPVNVKTGEHTVSVILSDTDGSELCRNDQKITVLDAVLPESSLIHTEWFHTDCIADYYGYEVFSEKHWKAIESFMKTAVRRRINMILTPVFTPPLDTDVGCERTTVQLVDVYVRDGKYSFGFEKLDRWIDLALKCGYKYFEISHFFTQWGANAAPKIMANVDGTYKRIFGWDTPVSEGVYPQCLSVFLPALTDFLRNKGIADRCYFHVSDEPSKAQLENYVRAKNIIKPYLQGFKTFDALSNYEFYSTGAVEIPVPASNHIVPFIENGVPDLWTYYCVSQGYKTSNRFLSMPLVRTRAIGVQMFKFRIHGFLQWGYNFYNTRLSKQHLDPYKAVAPELSFPTGDAYIVYPGAGGKAEESLRLLAFNAALTDLSAMNALAKKTSYDYVLQLAEDGLNSPITFENYPLSELYYVNLRNRVNRELEKQKEGK